jgi:malate synthase
MLQNIKSKIFSFVNTTLDKKTLLKIEKIVNLLKNLEKLIRDKETKLLEKRKDLLLKFKNEFPKFKKEIIKCIIVGTLVYLGFFILHLFYGLDIDLDLYPKDIHSIIPKPMTKEEIEEGIKKIIENRGRRK